MPELQTVVINTGPLLAIAAAQGDVSILQRHYSRVIVPAEVGQEIMALGESAFGVAEFRAAHFLEKRTGATKLAAHLANSLDPGEASVIQTALTEKIPLVCIDETVGRRVARLNGLLLTGSLGVLLKAHQRGEPLDLEVCVRRMRAHGVWLSQTTTETALEMWRSRQR